jgi:hypothetical protein
MAKITVDQLAAHPLVAEIRRGCFYCGLSFVDDTEFVYWVSAGLAIWLHVPCAKRWSMHLFNDAIKQPASQQITDEALERVREELNALPPLVEAPGAEPGR